MKIAILGAPGAGKSDFASAIKGQIVNSDSLSHHPLIVDDYVEYLRAHTGFAYGEMGNHVDDLQVAFKRREWELEWRIRDTITCGTILDTIAHCFIRSEDAAHNSRELALTQTRLRTIAETFGLLYTDTWDYDYAFYLPYRGEDPHSRLVDAALVELMQSYAPPVFSFKSEVKDDEKAEIAARTITVLEAEQSPSSDESGVRSSEEDGSPDRDSSGPMSDVPEQRANPDDA